MTKHSRAMMKSPCFRKNTNTDRLAGDHRKHTSRSMPNLRIGLAIAAAAIAAVPSSAHASLFHGETLDKVADFMSWVVLIIAPTIGITVFWLVHILPEKIAEKRKHPQAKAIQTLCLLSLFFGGLLWPLAWLWAYSKPVLYKMAYGTDTLEHDHGDKHDTPKSEDEVKQLRAQIASLQEQLSSANRGKA